MVLDLQRYGTKHHVIFTTPLHLTVNCMCGTVSSFIALTSATRLCSRSTHLYYIFRVNGLPTGGSGVLPCAQNEVINSIQKDKKRR